MKKRLLCLMMIWCLIVSMVPVTAFAQEGFSESVTETDDTETNSTEDLESNGETLEEQFNDSDTNDLFETSQSIDNKEETISDEKIESQIQIVGFEELDRNIAYQHMICGSNEEDINFPTDIIAYTVSSDGVSDSTCIIKSIQWRINREQSDYDEYSSQNDGAMFIYDLSLPEGYRLSENIELPTITVVVGNLDLVEPMAAADAGKNTDGFIAPIDDPDASAVKITTAAELAAISNDMYGSYVLMNDIDMSEYGKWNPIGKNLSEAFHGKFDGQGHTISGLSVDISFDSGTILQPYYVAGLFGVCDGAQIKNVSMQNVNISIKSTSGYSYDTSKIDSEGTIFAGAIAGYVKNSSVIYNCNVSGNISASASEEAYAPSVAGGLVGYANTAIVSYSYNVGTVTAYNGNATQAENAYAGGLVGRIEQECTIDRSYNGGAVSAQTLDYGDAITGGLAADSIGSTKTMISNSFNSGNIQSTSGNLFSNAAYVGGIVGKFQGEIDKVYSSGIVKAKANDPYGLNQDTAHAYAGGICATSEASSIIKNSAIVQEDVSASATGTCSQYRISNSGTKNNNITINYTSSGCINDADFTENLSAMTSADVYVSTLGWDFTKIWEMVSGNDFPQLRQVDTSSEEYNQEYIDQHLEYIEKGSYKSILKDYRWAQIYWSEENNFKSNLGEALYTVIDKAVNFSSLINDLFDDSNPYKVILADYISDQTVEESIMQLYKVKIPGELDKKYKKVEKFVKDNWKDDWGKLSDEDLYWMFHYEERTSDEWVNSDFEKHISEIVYETRHKGEGLEDVLGISTEILDKILEEKKKVDHVIDWFNGLIKYSGHVSAYIQANEEFKEILEEMCDNLPSSNSLETIHKKQLYLAIKSYTQYNNSEDLASRIFGNYLLQESVDGLSNILNDMYNKEIDAWIKNTFSAAAYEKLNAIKWAADKGWKISEYITKNGELQDCRGMLEANAYFEETMYRTLQAREKQFKNSQTFENACLFDAAFKFLKETEIYSMDIVIAYLDTYQTSWIGAIKNMSNTFMNSAIEEVQVNKLFLYNTYCHGTTYTLGGKVITIACPTNVYIYDSNNELVVSIEDSAVTYCKNNILAYTADAIKIVTLPVDQNYSVKIDATSDGSMNYSVSEYNAEKENVQTIVYNDVSIQKGDSFTGIINKDIQTEPQTYNLSEKDGTTVDKFETVTEKTNIPVTGIKIVDSKEILSVGESTSFKAEIEPANASIQSIVWSSSNPNVMSVSENGELTAVGEGASVISAQSLYGGVVDSVEVIVTSDEHTLLFKKQPCSAVYTMNDEAAELSVSWYGKNPEEVKLQWYESDSEKDEGVAIKGANKASYVPQTNEVGIKYYYVTIADSFETRTSERASIRIVEESALDSGTIGERIKWKLSKSYELRITGDGALNIADGDNIPWADYQGDIQSVEVDEGISSVGGNVFDDMKQLKTLILPKSLQTIEEGILSGCDSLIELSIPFVGTARDKSDSENSVLGAIFGKISSGGVTQYYTLSGTSLLGYNYDIPSSLRRVNITDAAQIPFGAFYNCMNLETITLNAGVEGIGGYAFNNCEGLKELTIPSTVTAISSAVLRGCNYLESISVPFIGSKRDANSSSDAVLGYFFGGSSDGTAQYYSKSGTSLSGSRYAIPKCLKTVEVTNAEQIPFGAFSNCTYITDIAINSGIEEINEYAFFNCVGIASFTVPDSVKQINEYAFNGCNSLKDITLPFVGGNRDVNGTYDGAFGYIFGRTSSASENYYVQYSILDGTSLSGYGYAVPSSLTNIIVTDATQIPVGAFSNLTNLKSVTLNRGLSKIGTYAFYNANGLTDIYYNDWDTEWEKIIIDSGNDILDNVTIHYLESPAKIYGASLRLTGDIGVNFYYEFKDSMVNDSDAGLNITVGNGETKRISLDEAVIDTTSVSGKKLYKFTCYVSAKQMSDPILIQASASGYEEEAHTYSIRQYADNILSKEKYSDELKYLVRVMMYYGASSQQYLEYNVSNLASNGLELSDVISEGDNLTADKLDAYILKKTDLPEGIVLYGANLSLKSETVLRYHYTLADGHDISEYTFTVNGKQYTPVLINGRYCIEIPNIRAQDLDEMFTVVVTDRAGNSGSATYGALTYVRNILKAGTEKYSQSLLDTVKSLYLYNKASEAYLATKV